MSFSDDERPLTDVLETLGPGERVEMDRLLAAARTKAAVPELPHDAAKSYDIMLAAMEQAFTEYMVCMRLALHFALHGQFAESVVLHRQSWPCAQVAGRILQAAQDLGAKRAGVVPQVFGDATSRFTSRRAPGARGEAERQDG